MDSSSAAKPPVAKMSPALTVNPAGDPTIRPAKKPCPKCGRTDVTNPHACFGKPKTIHDFCEDDSEDETDGIEVNDGFGI